MQFKYRLNSFYREIEHHRDGSVVVCVDRDSEVYAPFLGSVDRVVARQLAGREVPLPEFAAWKHSVMDPWQWIDKGPVFVGCLLPEGVLVVLDFGRPLFKRFPDSRTR